MTDLPTFSAATVLAAIARAGLDPAAITSNLAAAPASVRPISPQGASRPTMPHRTMHTAATTDIDGTPYLAIRRSSHEADGTFRKNMSGGIWINLSSDRPTDEIVRDLQDAAMAALAFVQLAKAEIDARTAAPTPIAKGAGKKAAVA